MHTPQLLSLSLSMVLLLQLLENCSGQLRTSQSAEIGDVRLVAFSGSPAQRIIHEGVLEIRNANGWGRVCTDYWTEVESFVACGNLGFPESIPLTEDQERQGQFLDEKIQYLGVLCFGVESSLSECMSVAAPVGRCHSGVSVKLNCRQRREERVEGIRLRGGALAGEGRVQIAPEHLYGGICGNGWNLRSGNIACRQLGFGTARKVYNGAEFGQGQADIWLDNVECRGNESTISHCRYQLIDSQISSDYSSPGCSNRQLASVSCFTPYSGYKEEIQLLDGQDDSVGRVVVNIGGKWGSICSDNWGVNEAAVVCRQLGLGYASKALQDVSYMTSSGQHLDLAVTDVRCTGSENSLNDCSFTRYNQSTYLNCGSSYKAANSYVGVACTNSSSDLQLDVLALQKSIGVDVHTLQVLQCAAEEKCLSQSAYSVTDKNQSRTLLRFSVSAWNRGTADFLPWEEPGRWEWHECHSHYHSMVEFAHFDILSMANFQRVAEGHKVSFCLADSSCADGYQPTYKCSEIPDRSRQGISVGCADTYYAWYDCQWIDITDVAPGVYTLRVVLNPLRLVPELDFYNNNVVCEMTYNGTAAWATSCGIENDFV